MISAIVAVDNDWGIGFNGELLERIPDDLKRFKELTSGNVIIMGRKTWDSLPTKPLPNRTNIVISNQKSAILNDSTVRLSLKNIKENINKIVYDVFIIGGGQIYTELLPYCDKVYVTKIFKSHENVDTYFPNLDKMENWKPIEKSPIYDYKDIQYQFWQYDKTN